MNRKLIVTLLRKDIQELDMITEGFTEMNEFPKAIIHLAQRKAEDIQSYIQQLSAIKPEVTSVEFMANAHPETPAIAPLVVPFLAPVVTTVVNPIPEKPIIIETIETDTAEELREDIREESVVPFESNVEAVINEEVGIENPNEEISIPIETVEVKELTRGDTETVESINTIEISEESKFTEFKNPTLAPDSEIIKTVIETRKTILGERNISTSPSRNEMLSRADNSISSLLANKKITDIKQAINIGDRFRFQRELFKGNGEDMNKTLNYINQLATVDEVLSFLQSKYGWASDNETADDFHQIIKRRFI